LGQFFNDDQILGAVLFFVGLALLSWCAKVERVEKAKMRDPKLKWAYIDAEGKKRDEVRKMQRRSIIINIVGGGMALYGFLSFLANVK
jgi:prolipoprotein diacylglyceryltransferase